MDPATQIFIVQLVMYITMEIFNILLAITEDDKAFKKSGLSAL